MGFNYEEYLTRQLNIINNENEYGLDIQVANEQAFKKLSMFNPDTVYIVIKNLISSKELEAISTNPIQIIATCEQNRLEKVQNLLNEFADVFNWKAETIDNTYIKQSYTTPVVLSNFNDMSYAYENIVYMTGTYYVLENIVDVESLEIDEVPIKALNFIINYNMTPNSQQLATEQLATSVKSAASFSISMTIPMISNTVVDKVLSIMDGSSSGNADFAMEITISGLTNPLEVNMKLINATISTTPGQVPSLQLGFIK